MTEETDREANVPLAEVQYSLIRARHIDPTCGEAGIRGYVREIAEAQAMLDAVDLSDALPSVSFAASWRDEPRR